MKLGSDIPFLVHPPKGVTRLVKFFLKPTWIGTGDGFPAAYTLLKRSSVIHAPCSHIQHEPESLKVALAALPDNIPLLLMVAKLHEDQFELGGLADIP